MITETETETGAVICVLTDTGTDRESWLSAWESCGREPFAHPSYVELFTTDGDQARCAVAPSVNGLAIIPLILRPIRCDAWAPETLLRDATSPYGYGGPYFSGDVAWEGLWSGFAQWMSENEIVSMFGRLALNTPTPSHLPPGSSVRSESDNVTVDLTRSAAEQWQHYEHKVRKNVKKALRANLRVEVKNSFTDLEEFSQLYESTMDRRGASASYYFGLDFFSSLMEKLASSCIAAEVRDETNRLVSAELVLCSDKYLYSFLGGTQRDAFPNAPNDLLKHEVICYGRESGRTGYVLGGGYIKDDGIFRYKKSFDPTGRTPFRRLEMIADQSTYDSLTCERLMYERSTSAGAQLAGGFFPCYRGEVLLDEEQIVQRTTNWSR